MSDTKYYWKRPRKREPVEFPTARFSATSIRWVEVPLPPIEQGLSGTPGIIIPPPPPAVINWDFRFVFESFSASMDWGDLLSSPQAPNLDFGSV